MHAAGPYALPLRARGDGGGLAVRSRACRRWDRAFAATATGAYLNQRKLSIFGGTNEIQKNIVAKMMGL